MATTPSGAWIRTRTEQGAELLYLSGGQAQQLGAALPLDGIVTADGDVWLLDFYGGLMVFSKGQASAQSFAHEGVLTGIVPLTMEAVPNRDVWVGGLGGAQSYNPQSGQWSHHPSVAGLAMPVQDIAIGPDGTVWLLRASMASFRLSWGVKRAASRRNMAVRQPGPAYGPRSSLCPRRN